VVFGETLCLRVAPPPEALRRAAASAKAGRHLCLSRGPVGWMPRLVGGEESRLYNRVCISRKLPSLWVGSFTAETEHFESDPAVPQARLPIRLKIRRSGVRRRPHGSGRHSRLNACFIGSGRVSFQKNLCYINLLSCGGVNYDNLFRHL
jgi:hypothetical protein